MPEKRGLHFEYDERTNVPTYEEVTSILKKETKENKKKRHQEEKKKKKEKKLQKKKEKKNNPDTKEGHNPKKILTILAISLLTLTILSTGGYFAYKNKDKLSSINPAKLTGHFSVTSEEEIDIIKKEFLLKPVRINLEKEEEEAKMSLLAKCEKEKGKIASDLRQQEEAECEKEKEPLEDKIKELEDDYDDMRNQYLSCRSDLSDCGDSSS